MKLAAAVRTGICCHVVMVAHLSAVSDGTVTMGHGNAMITSSVYWSQTFVMEKLIVLMGRMRKIVHLIHVWQVAGNVEMISELALHGHCGQLTTFLGECSNLIFYLWHTARTGKMIQIAELHST